MTQTNNEREALELAEWVEYLADCELQNAKAMPAGHLQAIPRGHAENFKKIAGLLRQSPISQNEQQEAVKRTPFGNCQFELCDLPGQCKSEGKCHHPKLYTSPPKQAIPEGWISVKDRLPPEGVDFLALTWFGDRKHDVVPRVLSFIPSPAQGGITYWMPILTAPTNTEK